MPRKMSKTAFFQKAMNLVKYHGEVTIYFKCSYGTMRRRKLRSNGKCFVSYMGSISNNWSHYSLSCFITHMGKITMAECFKHMISHDRHERIQPLMMEWGKGSNKRRMEYE